MTRPRWTVVAPLVVAGLLASAVFATPARAERTGAGGNEPCDLLERGEIEDAFGLETGRGEQPGLRCAWDVGDGLLMTAEVITDQTAEILDADAEGLFEDIADDLSAKKKLNGLGDRAFYGETSYGSVSLLVLDGNEFLHLDFGAELGVELEDTIDAKMLRKGMVKLGKKALKRL
jgi:hypothetical protein